MPTLSLAMIVKNEESTLGRILADVQSFCDEIVVVDTGSTDKTVEIAESFGARIFHFEWCDDFSAARNYSFSQCTGDWILWLDADDRIDAENAAKILALKSDELTRPDVDGVYFMYYYTFNEAGQCLWSTPRERIIRNNGQYQWEGMVYETVNLLMENERALMRLDIGIIHDPNDHQMARKEGRNIDLFFKSMAKGDRSMRTLFYLAGELESVGRAEEALALHREVLELEEADEWCRYYVKVHMAMCLIQLGQVEEGFRTLLGAIMDESDRAEAFNMLGDFYFYQEEWKKAIPFYRLSTLLEFPGWDDPDWNFVKYIPDYYKEHRNPQHYRLDPYKMLGECYEKLGDQAKAAEMFENALHWSITDADRDHFSSRIAALRSAQPH